jgi:hypothetical protein
MKMKKTLLLPVLLLSLLLSGCDYEAIIDNAVNHLAQQMTDPEDVVEPFIGFSETEAESAEELLQLKPEQLQNYTSRYSDYNTYTYFAHLNDTEKLLYHAYEYALDEALPYFWVDDRLLQGLERTADEVLEFLALDSAVVEQNYHYTFSGCTMTHTVWDIETSSESYMVVFVENFDRARLQQKEEAIQKAQQIMSEVPKDAPPRETAEYFYDYLGQNVTYETDIEGKGYLYTALCEGRTNCDGYTNAFALLCSMAEIPCIEINSDTPEDEEGHTWNAVYLEDRWGYLDATGAVDDVTSECENRRQERIYFGFPDAMLQEKILYADLLPSCSDGLTPIVQIPSGKIDGFNSKIKEAFEENDNKCAVILVGEGDLEAYITEELVNTLQFDLYYTYFETVDGRTVYYLFNDG